MKRKQSSLLSAAVALIILLTNACNTDSTYDVASSGDCIVTAATLGTLYRETTAKTPDGRDTTYRAAVTGALYPLHIDQVNNRIYNTDSLPTATEVERTVFSIFNVAGIAAIRSIATGQDTLFVKTDSTDCSVERFITVYSSDSQSKRIYSLQLNVHREEADSFVWRTTQTADAALQSLGAAPMRLVHRKADGAMLAYGQENGHVVVGVLASPTAAWEKYELAAAIDPQSVVASKGGKNFYALTSTELLASADGVTWHATGSLLRPDALVVCGTTLLVGLKDGSFVSSADGGQTWQTDGADEPEYLPLTDVCGVAVTSRTDNTFEDFVVTGKRADGKAVVWRRTVDLAGEEIYEWYYLPEMSGSPYNCPVLKEPLLFVYDGVTYMAGLTAQDHVAPLYESRDNGRTWKKSELSLPAKGGPTHMALAVSKDNFIWVADGMTGNLWRGRYNRMGWQQAPTVFD